MGMEAEGGQDCPKGVAAQPPYPSWRHAMVHSAVPKLSSHCAPLTRGYPARRRLVVDLKLARDTEACGSAAVPTMVPPEAQVSISRWWWGWRQGGLQWGREQ
eukprot:7380510-Prymnesium_polylepis.1